MTNRENTMLVKIGDEDLTVGDPNEDIRGRKVIDRKGEDIGKVDDLLMDAVDKKVRLFQVGSGGFLGLGEKKTLVPIDAITRITDDEVHINQLSEHVAGAPEYDPNLVADQSYWGGVYGYYGYQPYWGLGYMYPIYPYYPSDSVSQPNHDPQDLAR